MKRLVQSLVIIAAIFPAQLAPAAELGMQAPPLSISQWVKGSPVTITPGNTIYVVEFWATWCGPCRASIPHLTELQKKFKDKGVVVIGISDEDADAVKPFVEEQGAAMDYVVALDKGRETNAKYMEAFQRPGIPSAFVVDKKGQIVWVGHPMSGLDVVLQEVVDGTYSVEKAKQREARRLVMQQDATQIDAAFNAGDKAKLQAAAEAFFAKYPDEGDMLGTIAWLLLTHDNKELHDYALALKIAKAAVEVTKWGNPSIIDTYARALFETGDVNSAITAQEKAIAGATSEEEKQFFEQAMATYKEALKPKA